MKTEIEKLGEIFDDYADIGMIKKKSAHKSDKDLFMNAYDAIPYKIIGGVTNNGEIGLDFGDSPSDGYPLIYFVGGKNGYYNPSNLQEVSHEDFYNFYGVDEGDLDDDDFYEEDPGAYTDEEFIQ